MRHPDPNRLRRHVIAFVVVVLALVACKSNERTYRPSMELEVTPLPPVTGQLVGFTLKLTDVSYVEIFQGEELVWTVINDDGFDVPASFRQFTAVSAAAPRAVGYGINGDIVVADAKAAFNTKPPVADAGKPEAGKPDAAPPSFNENCPGKIDRTPDPDAGALCGGPGGLLIMLRIRNERAAPVDVYRTQQPPNQCTLEGRLRVFPGTVGSTTLFDFNIVRFLDGADPSLVLREMSMTTGGNCDLVFR